MRPSTLPPGVGVGFKSLHAEALLGERQPLSFVEVHAENYMGAGGRPHAQLRSLRERYELSIHGVGLSIGSPGALDRQHLARVRELVRRYEPASFSEHLAWSTHDDTFLNDLLPIAYTEETLERVVAHVDEIQTALGQQILLENPSTYVRLADSRIPEVEFIRDVAARTGCGLLLDVNNVFVSATNGGSSAQAYLENFPLGRVCEIHLAGHAAMLDDDNQPLLVDDHGAPVADPVWRLYEHVVERIGPVATLIEWDNDVPPWPVLLDEALAALSVQGGGARHGARAA